jgi:hypothetical protein
MSQARIFKIGQTLITLEQALQALTTEEVRQRLKHAHPEIAQATVRETPQADGSLLIEFLPISGKKG